MTFIPITTQSELDTVISRIRAAEKVKAHARLEKETSALKQQILKAQQVTIRQTELLDAIRVIVREELTRTQCATTKTESPDHD